MSSLPTTTVSVVLFGVGGVGSAVVSQLLDARDVHSQRFGLRFDIIALCDSSGACVTEGFDDDKLRSVVQFKKDGNKLAEWAAQHGGDAQGLVGSPLEIARQLVGTEGSVVVDCSATDATAEALVWAATCHEKGGAVMANKKPLSGDQAAFDALNSAENVARLGAESTVGAGTPIVATLGRLLASGDEVRRIEGTFSGTLGFLVSGMEDGRSYSELVQEAFKLGYTEPEPRDDLSGTDVARKALILARTLGWKLDMADVEVEALYPEELGSIPVPEFLARLPELDAAYARRSQEAQDAGCVLRYTACVADGKCVVGLKPVPKESPLGRLKGTLNMVEFHTAIYSPNPLVVQGFGAGVEVTAAGVIADMVSVAQAF